jgi:glycosyltransferase involved in cell wall biosynthesis
MFVTVIIPNYNCARWLPETIGSCIVQKEFIKEIIIVDDYSTDESWQILQQYQAQYPDLIRIFRNEVKGGNNARNLGFRMSCGDYIQWLDADDQLIDGKFKNQLSHFEAESCIDIVYSDWKLLVYDENGNLALEELKTHKNYGDFLYQILVDNWSPPINYLLRRSIAQQLFDLNAWNNETAILQDREYFTIAAIIGAKFGYVAGCYCIYNRWNKGSVSAGKIDLRYGSLEKILNRFAELLTKQMRLPQKKLMKYLYAIRTQKLLIKTAGFPSKLNAGDLKFRTVNWKIIRGFRTTIKTIMVLIRLNY